MMATGDIRSKKICLVVSSPLTVKAFLLEHIAALSKVHEVTLIANVVDRNDLDGLAANVRVIAVTIERKISPLRDFGALFRLFSLFRAGRYDVVHAVTPKASLLAMVAGYLAGVPVRIHSFSGQVWMTRTGLSRLILKNIDRVAPALATHTLVDCRSQKDFLIRAGFVTEEKSVILGSGSICGVDCEKFRPDPPTRDLVRKELGIDSDAVIFLYVGRLNRDKGVLDLARTFAELGGKPYRPHLLIVGPDEEAMRPEIERLCATYLNKVHFFGFTDTPQSYMAAADVLCLPSLREAFGMVIMEAAGAGIPAVGSRIIGISDAIVDGETGLLHEPGNGGDLAAKLDRLALDRGFREQLGKQARSRAQRDFSRERVTTALLAYYRAVLADAPRQPASAQQ